MMQAHPYLKANPVMVKARLLLSASDSKVSANNNGYKSNGNLRDKSGAGMLDAEEAVYLSTHYLPAGYGYTQLSSLKPGTSVTAATTRFYETNKVRIVMVFDKSDNNIIDSKEDIKYIEDIDIYLRDSSGNIVASSASSYNNVEIIDYYVEKTDNYTIEVCRESKSGGNTATPNIAIVWEY